MKKMVFMAAIVAACAAFVACSSDDDLVQQKPGVPEESVEEGIPMTVKVADFTSRGTDYSISGTNPLQEFTLYSTMSGAWETGKLFGKDSGGNWTTNTDLSWPDGNTHTFFGINDVENLADLDADSHKDAPTVTATTCSFNYALPTTLKPGTVDEYYYNSEDLKDLLVAKTTGSSTSGDPAGTLTVEFQHALAQIKAIKVYCSAANMAEIGMDGWQVAYHFRVNSIKLGGLKAVGTYTFDNPIPWAAKGDDVEFEIPLNIPDDDEDAFNRMTFVPGVKDDEAVVTSPTKTTLDLPLNETGGGLYLIPQKAEGALAFVNSDVWNLTGAYVELELQSAWFDPEDPTSVVYQCWNPAIDLDLEPGDEGYDPEIMGTAWDAESSRKNGFQRVRVPLKFDIRGGSGKGYTLIIDISRAIGVERGKYVYDNMSIFGAGIEINV